MRYVVNISFLSNQIRTQIMANEGICLDALDTFTGDKNSSLARIVNCADTPRQLWSYDFQTLNIIQRTSNNCLTAAPNIEKALGEYHSEASVQLGFVEQQMLGSNAKDEARKFNVSTMPCTESKLQKWILLPFEWKWSERMMLSLLLIGSFSLSFPPCRLMCNQWTTNIHVFRFFFSLIWCNWHIQL